MLERLLIGLTFVAVFFFVIEFFTYRALWKAYQAQSWWGVERWAQAQPEATLSKSSLAVIREGSLCELPLHSSKEDLSELLA